MRVALLILEGQDSLVDRHTLTFGLGGTVKRSLAVVRVPHGLAAPDRATRKPEVDAVLGGDINEGIA